MAETNAEYPLLEHEGEFGGSVHRSATVSSGRSPERAPVLPEMGLEVSAEKFSGLLLGSRDNTTCADEQLGNVSA